jgi:hypothetical protein
MSLRVTIDPEPSSSSRPPVRYSSDGTKDWPGSSGRLDDARTILMLAAGAGITVALALYRQEPPCGCAADRVPG